jgi:hypothetical protein
MAEKIDHPFNIDFASLIFFRPSSRLLALFGSKTAQFRVEGRQAAQTVFKRLFLNY